MKKTFSHNKILPSTVVVIDLVCGMELEQAKTKIHIEHNGEMYYFCANTCKNHFVNDPEKYTGMGNY